MTPWMVEGRVGWRLSVEEAGGKVPAGGLLEAFQAIYKVCMGSLDQGNTVYPLLIAG